MSLDNRPDPVGESVNEAFSRNHALKDDPTNEGISMGFTVRFMSRFNVDDAVTQILENNLLELSELRRTLERTNHKHIHDVRLNKPLSILEGFEGTLTYEYLLDLIEEMKDGIAFRRVQQMQERAAAFQGEDA